MSRNLQRCAMDYSYSAREIIQGKPGSHTLKYDMLSIGRWQAQTGNMRLRERKIDTMRDVALMAHEQFDEFDEYEMPQRSRCIEVVHISGQFAVFNTYKEGEQRYYGTLRQGLTYLKHPQFALLKQ